MTATRAKQILADLNDNSAKMGDIKKLGRAIKKDHQLALALWATGGYRPRLLATLVFDKAQLSESFLEQLAADMLAHEDSERDQLADWLMANQLMKSKRTARWIESWQDSASPMLRRLFWYHQARLRWTGQTPPDNSPALLDALERELSDAPSPVQWAMNFCAGQIGVHEPQHRARCIALGEDTGLYRDEQVARNCTPNYLPEFIRIEVAKRA